MVSESDITNKPVADTSNGFNQTRRITIAFPKVIVGSVILFHYKQDIFATSTPNHFVCFYDFDDLGGLEAGSKWIFDSQIPLTVHINNPNLFTIREETCEGKHTIEITSRENLRYHAIDEPFGNYPSELSPKIEISSTKTYHELYDSFVSAYEEVLSQSLPHEFDEIYQAAQKSEGFFNQANTIMSQVYDVIRYMGDWRSVEGRRFPQSFSDLVSKGYGDCKDFATVTTKILRMLGYKADVALVHRGNLPPRKTFLPVDEFDHAIVCVNFENDYVWLDPTNPIAFSHGVRLDIANRNALILKKSTAELAKIKSPSPQENYYEKQLIYTFKDKNTVIVDTDTRYQGIYASSFQESYRDSNHNQFVDSLLQQRSNGFKIIKKRNITIPEITSITSPDYQWSGEIECAFLPAKTSMGTGLIFKNDLDLFLKIKPESYVSGFFFGLPKQETEQQYSKIVD